MYRYYYHFFSYSYFRNCLTLRWKQVTISMLHFYIHINTKIGITKSIPIEGELRMERKFSFPLLFSCTKYDLIS